MEVVAAAVVAAAVVAAAVVAAAAAVVAAAVLVHVEGAAWEQVREAQRELRTPHLTWQTAVQD